MRPKSYCGCTPKKTSLGDVLSLINDNAIVLVVDEDENVLGQYDGRNSISKVLMNHVVSSIDFRSQRIIIHITEETV